MAVYLYVHCLPFRHSSPLTNPYRFFHPAFALNQYSGNMDDVLPAFQARTYVWNRSISMDGNLLNKWIQSLSPHVRHCMFRRYLGPSSIRFPVLSVRVLRHDTASLNHLLLYKDTTCQAWEQRPFDGGRGVFFWCHLALFQWATPHFLFRTAQDSNLSYRSVSGIALTIELPSKCFAGRNSHFLHIGSHWCNIITTMAVSSWLAVVTSTSWAPPSQPFPLLTFCFSLSVTIATILTFVAARKAIELAKMPPPVFPEQAQTPVMRWLNRNDPFASYNRQYPWREHVVHLCLVL